MLAREIISDAIKPLQYSDSGEHALFVMRELNLRQMPVTDDKKYIGIISVEELTLAKHLHRTIADIHTSLKKPYVHQSSHLFDVLKAGLEYNTRIIPVLSDENDSYLGVISAENCLKAFAKLNSLSEEGGIIEISVPLKNYSVSEIARIIEENEVRILALYTHINSHTNRVELTVKTNSNELAAVILACERHGYEIKGFFHEEEYTEDLKEHYDAFLHYMNV